MARPKKFLKTLSEEELIKIKELSNSRTEEVRKVQRAKIILLASQGKSNETISKEVGVSIPTICKVLKKWTVFDLDAALSDLARSGRPPVIDVAARTWIIQLACHLPQDYKDGPHSQLWTITSLCNYIHKHCMNEGHECLANVQESTVWEILNSNDIKPHKIKYYLERKDPDFKEKAKKVLLLYKRVAWILQMTREQTEEGVSASKLSGEVVISYDEKPGIQAIGNITPDLRPNPAVGAGCVGRDYEYKRYGTLSLLAGIDLMSGEVIGLVRKSHTSADFIDFLKTVDDKYDKDLKISIILDNHSVHRCRDVMEFLASKPERFEFTFTPKHASWLNLIESFFSKCAKQCLKHLRVNSIEELKTHIESWLKETNETPVVYRWQWKLEDIQGAFADKD